MSSRLGVVYWWSAVTLLVAAAIHQFFQPVYPPALAVAILAPPLFLLGWTAFAALPAIDESVAAADRELDARSLFTTAWELRFDSHPDEVAALLLARCEAKISAWDALSRELPGPAAGRPGLIPVTCCAIGGLLLAIPAVPERSPTAYPATGEAARQALPNREAALALGKLLHAGPAFRARAADPAASPADDSAGPSPGDAAATLSEPPSTSEAAPGDRLAVPATQAASPSPPASGDGEATAAAGGASGAKIARQTPGNHRAAQTPPIADEFDALAEIREVNIDVLAKGSTQVYDERPEGVGLTATETDPGAAERSARQPSRGLPGGVSDTALSPVQRVLVRQYFNRLEHR